jgi:lipoprotein-anchoring transpeptidase ErfK/SrfK
VSELKGGRAVVALAVLAALVAVTGVVKIATNEPARARTLAISPTTTAPRATTTVPRPVATTMSPAPTVPRRPAIVYEPRPVPFPALAVPVETTLATPRGSIVTYAAPGGAPVGRVGTWYGVQLTLPVIAAQTGWLEIRLPWRPNGSTAWVSEDDVGLSTTSYFMAVSLSATQLVVYQAGQPIYDFPAGLGLPATPTPLGNFFVAIHESHPSAFYGPLILDTSGHSEALQHFDGEDDAIIAVHGPISASADARIGSTGARVSNGCIRLHNADLARLAIIPPGTPLEIVP